MIKKSLYKEILLAIFFVMLISQARMTLAQPFQSSITVALDNLDLNRTAATLTENELQQKKFPYTHTGFQWQADDNATLHWRPQGIAGLKTASGRRFLAVSWYGLDDYANRGVRVSFVDVTNMNSIHYRHVLLVNSANETFANMHAGGLVVYQNKELHVPDSRSKTDLGWKIHVFSIDAIKNISPDEIHGYSYILQRKSFYYVPIKPSFLSYDWSRQQVVVGSCYECSSSHIASCQNATCRNNTQNRLAWYTVGQVNGSSPSSAPFFSEMQGVASDNGVLWTTSSYGRNNYSHLHIANFDVDTCNGDNAEFTYEALVYPPGLEDMHISLPSDANNYNPNIWMLTEFGPNEGGYKDATGTYQKNNRIVFATKKNYLMPSKRFP